MNLVTQVFAVIAALTHIVVGTLERFFYDRPAVRIFLTTSAADAPEVTLWRSGVAAYNVLLGLGLVAGVTALHTGDVTVGRTLIIYLCAFLIASAIIFVVSFPRLWRGALGQGLPPALALLATPLF
ncbi:putative membrane protein [Streptomyces davaonensis JCM 4913]|uniref:Putative membrane protein n=1 Tax=Streptomyces davaonensis (strain DSM 101723 / JCM 4913 / KCC S-0913 / 768) TaxID=1214101 RepID=K4QV49_STRDJ|nr:DUF1304 domain-containing protein [Streptomyces davaonensis]CCK24858.1 putative membrane protein [Streptomyces davaonensis JCM 4913]